MLHAIILFFQQAAQTIDIPTLIGALTPLVVWGVTWLINRFPIHNAILVGLIVPVISLLATWVTNLIVADSGMAWYIQFALGLVAVFVNETVTQIKKTAAPKAVQN